MTMKLTFAPIAAGLASPEDARRILSGVEVDANSAGSMIDALRSFVWKVLNQRRRDAELAKWHDVLKRVQARLRKFEGFAAQVQLLADLLSESLAVANKASPEAVLRRKHAKAVLALLAGAPSGTLSKQDVMARLGLKDANAWRLMELLADAGFVERHVDGREVVYRLTEEGRRAMPQAASLPTYADLDQGCFEIYQIQDLSRAVRSYQMDAKRIAERARLIIKEQSARSRLGYCSLGIAASEPDLLTFEPTGRPELLHAHVDV